MAGLRIKLDDIRRQLIAGLPLLISALVVSGCLSKAENRYTSEWTSHTCDKRGNGVVIAADPSSQYTNHSGNKAWCFSVQDTELALKEATAGSAPDKPLIVLVHGRGAHPRKALKNDLLHYLAYENRANVIMFHWPSFKGVLGYAKDSAESANGDLSTFLSKIDSYTKDPNNNFTGKKILLVHSMGNIVLRELAKKPPTTPNPPILETQFFDTLILSGPDVPPDKHHKWMDKINIAKHQYLLIGYHDTILVLSQHLFRQGPRLGRCVTPKHSSKFDYVNFNGTGVNHLYYINQGKWKSPAKGAKMKGHPGVRSFFAQVLRGEPASPSSVDKLYVDPRYPSRRVWSFRNEFHNPMWIDCD